MTCLRCEILRAKLRAIYYHNTGKGPAELVNALNAAEPGVYYLKRLAGKATVLRKNNVEGSPAIEIWVFNEHLTSDLAAI